MTTVLRVASPAGLLTADVFEALFQREFATIATVRTVAAPAFLAATCGPAPHDGRPDAVPGQPEALAAFTAGVCVVSLGHDAIPFAPRLLALRNAARQPWRLLLIAHTAVRYAREWLLLSDLLVPGDCIVAPGHGAAEMIRALVPDLAPFVRTIPHPVRAPASMPDAPRDRLVTLGRIHADKLLHRLIDAYALLRARGVVLPPLACHGALDEGSSGGPSTYARSLQARIERHGLQDAVTLAGPVLGDAKVAALARARAVINLSVSLEEACPKTPIEAQAAGAPVLATDWIGHRDVVGPTGVLVPVHQVRDGDWDVAVDAVADGLAALLARPLDSAASRAFAERFAPARQLPEYAGVLEAASSAAASGPRVWPASWAVAGTVVAAPASGLASQAGVLHAVSRASAWRWYLDLTDTLLARQQPTVVGPPSPGERFWAAFDRALLAPAAARIQARGAHRATQARHTHPSHTGTVADALRRAMRDDRSMESRVGAAFDLIAIGALADVHATWRDASAPPDGPLAAYLLAEVADRVESPSAALAIARRAAGSWPWQDGDAMRVRQFSRLCRHAGEPAAAIPWIDEWLSRHPDERESGSVWLDLALCHIRGDTGHESAIAGALAAAERLLGAAAPAVAKARLELEWRRLTLTGREHVLIH